MIKVLHLVLKTIVVVNLDSDDKHPKNVQAMHLCDNQIDM
jgi:hypothetical protein